MMSIHETQIVKALREDLVIDITTTGRKSGQPRRIEIWFYNLDDKLYLTGLPGLRSWVANLNSNPRFIFHLKESIAVDIPGQALPISDEKQRRHIFSELIESAKLSPETCDLDERVAASPLFQLELELSAARSPST